MIMKAPHSITSETDYLEPTMSMKLFMQNEKDLTDAKGPDKKVRRKGEN